MKSSYSIVLKTDFKLAVTNVNHSLKNEGFTIIDSIEHNELERAIELIPALESLNFMLNHA